ncbi:MAG TPA: D-aminoacyl-tRNA deacylase [Lentimicrobium sp.]|nr:D-aminoacyl-tRNA deacylase [Lentimicrobium sp.]
MRVVVQRVSSAKVTHEDGKQNAIGMGLMILLGIETRDDESDVSFLTGKLSRLRIFDDDHGVMNLSLMDVNGEALVVSQFTLHAETRKGNRPSYIQAARPEKAIPLYEMFLSELHKITGLPVKAGWFGARMKVELANEGPVTIIIDSRAPSPSL